MEPKVAIAEPCPTLEDARTSCRTSARTTRVELITRGEPRRRWSIEQKQAIAAESLVPGASPAAVARRHGISSGLLHAWRKSLLAAQPGAAARFVRVKVTAEERAAVVPVASSLVASAPQPTEVIEIILPNGTMLRLPAGIDPRILRGLLSVVGR